MEGMSSEIAFTFPTLTFYFPNSHFHFPVCRTLLGVRELEGMSPEISLLHMNCEGCEWEMLETLLKDPDVIKKVPQV